MKHRNRSRRVVTGAAAAAAGMSMAAVAWACVPINEGPTDISPTSGPAGTVITAHSNLSLAGPWPLMFKDPGLNIKCHHSEVIGEGQAVSQHSNGDWHVTGTGVIPVATQKGTAEVCYSIPGRSSSVPANFTVT